MAEVVDGEVVVHGWLKQAILLCFRLRGLETIELGPFEYHDRIPLKRGYAACQGAGRPGGVGPVGLLPRPRRHPHAVAT